MQTSSESESRHLAANEIVALDRADAALVVEDGEVLVFAVREVGMVGTRSLVCSRERGELLLGVEPSSGLRLEAIGNGPAQVRPIGGDVLASQLRSATTGDVEMVASWVHAVATTLADGRNPVVTAPLVPVDSREEHVLAPKSTARATERQVWIRVTSGAVYLCGVEDARVSAGDALLPLDPVAWITTSDEARLVVLTAEEVMAAGDAPLSLASFGRHAMSAIAAIADTRDAAREVQIDAQVRQDRALDRAVVHELAEIVPSRRAVIGYEEDPLVGAMQIIAGDMGASIAEVIEHDVAEDTWQRAQRIGKNAGLRVRAVRLPTDWMRYDVGSFVGFSRETKQPMAIRKRTLGGYQIADPVAGVTKRLNAKTAQALSDDAIMLSTPLGVRARTIFGLTRAALHGSGFDLGLLILIGLLAGIGGLALPIATRTIFDEVVPSSDAQRLAAIAAAIVFVYIGILFAQLLQGVLFVRFRARFHASGLSMLWGHLLRLPASFFTRYQVGDLLSRFLALDSAMHALSGAALSSMLSGLFGLASIVLLFVLGPLLGVVGIALAAAPLIFVISMTPRDFQLARDTLKADRAGNTIILELIKCIPKLRISAADRRGFLQWARIFSLERRLTITQMFRQLRVTTFVATWTGFASLIIVVVIVASGLEVNVGNYMAYTVAFGQVLTASIGLSTALATVLDAIPTLEQSAPIITAKAETDEPKQTPPPLEGAVALHDVTFRYIDDGPLILKGINIEAAPGEYIALVGPSGAGKSSVFRILLGFEIPESGTVTYDGFELDRLDKQAVRRQMGVVLQQAQLFGASIFQNIAAGRRITRDDAWAAARAAGVSDDIKAMPMGLETVIVEGGGTLSGGQRQRLLIARSLAGSPRVVLFDEATSALDNRTQAIVADSLSGLNVTRIAIAHRLSTIIDADRIYVLVNGEVAQTGSYEELVNIPGPFQELAKRQVIT